MNYKANKINRQKKIIINNINNLLYKRNWSLKNLSEYSNIPYESIKKLVNGKITNPSIYSINEIANAFNCSLDYLLGNENISSLPLNDLPLRAFTLLEEIAKLEIYLCKINKSNNCQSIPLLIPIGNMKNGFVFNTNAYDMVDVSKIYLEDLNAIICGLKITSSFLSPVYFAEDILLVAKDRYPYANEAGVFLYKGRFFIKQYNTTGVHRLTSICGNEDDLIIDDISNLHFFGRIVTVIRK